MNVSIIGTGRMGQALATALSQTGHDVLWNSRSLERVKGLVEDLKLTAKPVLLEQALGADIIIPALWHQDQLSWLPQHERELNGRIVVNITNPFNETFEDFTTDPRTSSAEELQRLVPSSKMIGAFKNTFWDVFRQPLHNGERSDVYVTGDDTEAKEKVIRLLQGLSFRILDGGALANNRVIERMTLFSRELSKRNGHYPYVSWRLWGGK